MTESAYRSLPSVDALLNSDQVTVLFRDYSYTREALAIIARDVLSSARAAIKDDNPAPSMDTLIAQINDKADRARRPWPACVINATGVVLHTNLGRAPLSPDAALSAASSAQIYSTLEFDLASGKRGSRNGHISELLSQTTGAEAGIAVNNNASGLLLSLAGIVTADPSITEIVVSRGEAVEIGGGFRIPDVTRQSGAELVEVGTTNRTYASDYEAAITPRTAGILKVHPSNFTVEGFTHAPELEELVAVGDKHQIPVINDLGSGCLVDTRKYGLAREPMAQSSVLDGAALTLFSGDKLLGGPQAGLIVGKRKWIDLVAKHPLARVVRIDKMTLSAIASTLASYFRGDFEVDIPIWSMISATECELTRRAEQWRKATGTGVVERSSSAIGGGSLPGQTLPTSVLMIEPAGSAETFTAYLRESSDPVVARIENNRILLDPRTVLPNQDTAVIEAIKFAVRRLKQLDQ